MFHFPTFPPHALCVQARVTGDESSRVSPFGNPRITARLAAPRGLSQPPTSFIGSWCQGIHRAPLITWPQRCSRPLCSSQGTDRPNRNPTAHNQPDLPGGRRPVNGWSRPAHTRAPHPEPEGPGHGAGATSPKKHPLPQDPTACLRPRDPHPPVPTHHPEGRRAVLARRQSLSRTGKRSTHEHQAGTLVRQLGLDTTANRDARCSLERR